MEPVSSIPQACSQAPALLAGNGKDNVYVNPTTSPDPGLKEVKGRFGYGMDLDGKAATSPSVISATLSPMPWP